MNRSTEQLCPVHLVWQEDKEKNKKWTTAAEDRGTCKSSFSPLDNSKNRGGRREERQEQTMKSERRINYIYSEISALTCVGCLIPVSPPPAVSPESLSLYVHLSRSHPPSLSQLRIDWGLDGWVFSATINVSFLLSGSATKRCGTTAAIYILVSLFTASHSSQI